MRRTPGNCRQNATASLKPTDKEGVTIRTSGILLPVSSLPSPYGIGNLGREAFRFLDFLREAGQSYWQILPIGPTGYGDSPYQSFSAFAANPYLIDPDQLVEQGLLKEEELREFDFGDNPEQVDYGALFRGRFRMLHIAVKRFVPNGGAFQAFCEKNTGWLEDYALFMALKAENGMVSFQRWPDDLRLRRESALNAAKVRLADEIRFWKVTQFLFRFQWNTLKDYAHQNGIRIVGDLPIYVSPDSADLWAHGELFQLDKDRRPTEVAGCPPDLFASEGQLWGNPLYDWKKHEANGFRWWLERLSGAAEFYDAVRVDHFRGFAGYYAVPAGSKNAVNGRWRKGPGIALINTLKKELPQLLILAEDLGFLTDDVRELLAESGFPGMKVLQFAFNPAEESDYLPHNHRRNCVVYTGTHDNPTAEDWGRAAPPEEISFARRYLGVGSEGDLTGALIRAAQASVADTCIIPLQDYIRLGAQARINTPGTVGQNWCWRLNPALLTSELAHRIREITQLYNRLPAAALALAPA